MRPRLRTTHAFCFAPPLDDSDAYPPAYTEPRTPSHGLLLPFTGHVHLLPAGEQTREVYILLTPPDAALRPRDGIWLQQSGAQPDFRCLRADRFPLHVRALITPV